MSTLIAALFQLALYVIVFCGIGSIIGEKMRGRKLAGALLGLIGPIGWVLVLLFQDQRRKCPACRSAVDSLASKCARCGSALPVAARAR